MMSSLINNEDDNACDFVKFSLEPVHKSPEKPGAKHPVVLFPCEFRNCTTSLEKLEDFMSHVLSHLSEIQLKEEEFICEWRLCPFTSRGIKEFLRHFHFHTFHAKIKTQGRSILLSHRQKPPIRPCSLDSSEVNILPDLSEEFICQWEDCQEPAFEEAQRYYWHVASHASYHSSLDHKTKGKPCRWHLCNTVVKTNSKLKDHLKFHSQERSVACPTCGNLFSNRVKFIDHCNRQLLPEDKSYACSYCSKTFAVERLLRDHVRSHINTKKCPLCPMTVTTNSNLRNHLRYRHSNVRQFPCSECSYAAKSNHDLQSHIRSLHGSPQIKCFLPKCDYICEDKEAFNTHLQDYHRDEPKFYVCHECDKRFERGQYLSRHLSRMHGVKLPRGHKRFRYLENPDGNYLLQVERFDFLAEDEEGPLEEEMEDEFSADDPDET